MIEWNPDNAYHIMEKKPESTTSSKPSVNPKPSNKEIRQNIGLHLCSC
jgi:hypothetical protein